MPDVTICLPVADSSTFLDWTANEKDSYIRQAIAVCLEISLRDRDMLPGILLGACRALAFLHGPGEQGRLFTQYALFYKTALIRSTSKSIAAEGDLPSNFTIAKSITLALDDVSFRIHHKV